MLGACRRSRSPWPRSHRGSGELDANLARHHELLEEARDRGAGLVVFPELGLTGYLLQDLAAEVAMRLDDPRLAGSPARDDGPVGDRRRSSRNRPITGCSSPRRCSRTARSATSTGSCSCRRTACSTSAGSSPPGDLLRATPSRLGVGVGIAICEDFWHLTVPQLLALDGAQILINVSSSPGRDLAATNEVGLGTATSWRTLMRTYAQLTTSFVIFCNRVGVDESISFWGGSEVIAPTGAGRSSARRSSRRACSRSRSPLADLRRERLDAAAPARRAARAPGPRADADRRRASRAGLGLDRRRAGRGGPRRRPGRAPSGADRIGRSGVPRRKAVGRSTATRTTPDADVAAADGRSFDLPDELAIDTDVARRVIGEFIRGQLRQAGFERAVLGLSGGIDSALVAYLVAEAIGADKLLCVLMPYRTSSPMRRAPTPRRSSAGSAARASSSTSARWSTGSSPREPDATPAPPRQLHGPPADGRASTTDR